MSMPGSKSLLSLLLSLSLLACASPPEEATELERSAATSSVYLQGAASVPQTPQAVVRVELPQPQGAGHLNVVLVGWNDTSQAVPSLSDARGNTYRRAVGPTRSYGCCTQSIYYAAGIAAGANTVTVTFSRAVRFPDVRVLEYAGLETTAPLDVAVGAAGNSAESVSGSVTTRNANDLLVAGNVVATTTAGPGSGYTQRILTTPDGDIAQDRTVDATGTYGARAPLASSGGWVMQMAAFRDRVRAAAADRCGGGRRQPGLRCRRRTGSGRRAGDRRRCRRGRGRRAGNRRRFRRGRRAGSRRRFRRGRGRHAGSRRRFRRGRGRHAGSRRRFGPFPGHARAERPVPPGPHRRAVPDPGPHGLVHHLAVAAGLPGRPRRHGVARPQRARVHVINHDPGANHPPFDGAAIRRS